MYRIDFTEDAEHDLARLDPSVRRRILKGLQRLLLHVEEVPHEALKGKFNDLFKLRVGDYRVLYDLMRADHLLLVHEIKHRREIYRER